MVVAITGANGFLGQHLCCYLQDKGLKIKPLTRQQMGDLSQLHDGAEMPWLTGVKTIIHTAAIAHSGHGLSDSQQAYIRATNVDATLAIANKASGMGVRQFIFISSAHVYGRSASAPVDESAELLPSNIYGICKAEAEYALTDLAAKTGMDLLILRPPLLYGPGVSANFLRLIRAISRGLPLPIASLTAERSYCHVDNVASSIVRILRGDHGWNDVYNITDATPLTLPKLCELIAQAMEKPSRQWSMPEPMLEALLLALRKRSMIESLCKPLVLDTKLLQQTFHWTPPIITQAGIQQTVNHYREQAQ